MKPDLIIIKDGEPIGKGRPRFTRSGHVFTPKKTKDFEIELGIIARQTLEAAGLDLITVGLTVEIQAYFTVPKSWTRKKKSQALSGEIFKKNPDIDNIAKIVLDGLNGIIFADDSQVHSLTIKKARGVPDARIVVNIFVD